MTTVELQITERARKFKGEALNSLYPYIDAQLLQESYERLNRRSAAGIDGKRWEEYGKEFPQRREDLLEEFKSGRYKAPAVRRVYIPKDKDGRRPIGISTIEDKVLQESVRKVLEPVYEEEFKPFSYGFRRGHSPHEAQRFVCRTQYQVAGTLLLLWYHFQQQKSVRLLSDSETEVVQMAESQRWESET
ncbi:MAG: reverse transcriptase domain-containing protein [Bacteroidales bacterium]|nr:reverse transcriptase domain-containing protein [Bacteroidales bacterium]